MTTAWYGTQYSDRRRQLREYHKAQFYRSTGLSRTTSEVGMSSFTVSLLVGRRDLELFQRAMRTRPASSPSFVCPRAINARAPVPGLPGSASAPVLSCDGSSLQNDDVIDTYTQGSTSSDVAEHPDVVRHRPMHHGMSDSKQAPELITSSLSSLFMLNRDLTSLDRQPPTRIRPFRRLANRSTHDSMTSRSGGVTSQISVDDCGPLAQRLKVRHHVPTASSSSSNGSIHQMAPVDESLSTTNLDQQFAAESSGDVFGDADHRRSTSGDDYVTSDVINCRELSPPGGSTSDSSDGGRCEAGVCPPGSDQSPTRSDATARAFGQMPPIGAPPSPTKFAARGRTNRTGSTRDAAAMTQCSSTVANSGLKYRLGCCGYPDPVSDAPPDFQQRICELQLLQLETIRSEKMRRSTAGTMTAAAAAAAAVQRRIR